MENKIIDFVKRPEAIMQKGDGMYLYDTEGKAYLDMCAGWGSDILGHSPPLLQEVLAKQSRKLLNSGPLYYSEEQLAFAAELCRASGMGRAFFVNSGADANENALKLARKYGAKERGGACQLISLQGGFHGRTLSMMAATAKESWQKLFLPLPEGFVHVKPNLAAIEKAITKKTCAVMIELIQGEGGVNVMDEAFIKQLRELTSERGVLLIVDEIQTGMGRCGKLFLFEQYKIRPDILTLGKGLGAGYPMAAMLCCSSLNIFDAGDIGGTFNGQPLAMACGRAVLRVLGQKNLVAHAAEMGELLQSSLRRLGRENPFMGIKNIRGRGLLLAFDVAEGKAALLADGAFEKGLLVNALAASSIRLLPPLILSRADVDTFIRLFQETAAEVFS